MTPTIRLKLDDVFLPAYCRAVRAGAEPSYAPASGPFTFHFYVTDRFSPPRSVVEIRVYRGSNVADSATITVKRCDTLRSILTRMVASKPYGQTFYSTLTL